MGSGSGSRDGDLSQGDVLQELGVSRVAVGLEAHHYGHGLPLDDTELVERDVGRSTRGQVRVDGLVTDGDRSDVEPDAGGHREGDVAHRAACATQRHRHRGTCPRRADDLDRRTDLDVCRRADTLHGDAVGRLKLHPVRELLDDRTTRTTVDREYGNGLTGRNVSPGPVLLACTSRHTGRLERHSGDSVAVGRALRHDGRTSRLTADSPLGRVVDHETADEQPLRAGCGHREGSLEPARRNSDDRPVRVADAGTRHNG